MKKYTYGTSGLGALGGVSNLIWIGGAAAGVIGFLVYRANQKKKEEQAAATQAAAQAAQSAASTGTAAQTANTGTTAHQQYSLTVCNNANCNTTEQGGVGVRSY